MADPKQVYRATDAAPQALYAKRTAASDDVYPLLATSTGALATGSLGIPPHDYIVASFGSLTDVYNFKSGGSSGTIVCTITITYTTTSKAVISTIART